MDGEMNDINVVILHVTISHGMNVYLEWSREQLTTI